MKKVLCVSLLCTSSLATAAQSVTDVDATNQLKMITSQLEMINNTLASNKQKIFTCTDGEKNYTAGLEVIHDNWRYRCTVKGEHVE